MRITILWTCPECKLQTKDPRYLLDQPSRRLSSFYFSQQCAHCGCGMEEAKLGIDVHEATTIEIEGKSMRLKGPG